MYGNFSSKMDHDFLTSLLDEVTLEGLDGITLSMLWIRLQNRSSFSIALDGESKEFFWECLAVHKDIQIYELPAPRILTSIYNRYDHVDNELGIVLESAEKILDPYPIAFIKDGDVRGSCSTYHTRICITSEIRSNSTLLLSLSEVNKKWGEKLVLVGSPKLRLLSLIGPKINPLIELTQEEYCLLERIGRSRYLGEVTQGEGGLTKLDAPFSKQIHYYRKNLSAKGLVTKQLHYMKSVKGIITVGSLFHLTRFYTPHKSRLEYLMKCICDLLKEKPHQRELCKVVKEQLKIRDTTFRKLVNGPYRSCVRVFYLPYKETLSDTLSNKQKASIALGRMIQVVQLLKHIDEMGETDHHGNNKEKNRISLDVHFDFSKLNYEMPLYQVYETIQNAGSQGINSLSIGQMLTLPKLEIRSLIDLLLKRRLIVSILKEKGRTKEVIYIDKKIANPIEGHFELPVRESDFNQEKTLSVRKQHHKKYNKPVKVSPSDLNDHVVKKIKLNDTVNESIIQGNESKNEFNQEKNIEKIKSQKNKIEISGKIPTLVSLTEKISPFQASSCQMTDRKLKRFKMLLDHLKSVGSATMLEIHKFLLAREKEENYNFRLDKRSTSRMIHVLFLAKELKIYTAVIKSNERKVEVELICDKTIDSEDPRIKTAVQQAKSSYFIAPPKPVEENTKAVTRTPKKIVGSSKNNKLKRKSSEPLFREKILMNPKCMRCKALHTFLFYLVYGYEGHSGDHSKTPVVYHDSMTWKRYVPPLSATNREGWCFLVDVYNQMPLSIFVKVFNLRHRIKHISEYLNDDEKCHYLLIDLPHSILKTLLDQRVFLFKVDDVLKYLCCMGLISFGPQIGKLKQEIFLYVHRKAILKDTTKSTPGYMFIDNKLSYEKKVYLLNTLQDVENFWADMEHICLHTPLGKFDPESKKFTPILDQRHKPEFLEVLKFHNFDEITDSDSIPGDGLGAGGFDSSLFFHYSRNWTSCPGVRKKRAKQGLKNPVYMQNLLKHKEKITQESPSRLQRLQHYAFPLKEDSNINIGNDRSIFLGSLARKSKKKKNIKPKRIEMPKPKTKRSIAKRKLLRKRIEWHAQEDSVLLLCKVASVFLDPTAKPLVVPYVVVKDLLLEKFPTLSADKTADACRRRINFIMSNSATAYNVSIFLEEAKQDKELVKEIDRFKPIKTDAAKDLFSHVLKRLTENITKPVVYRHNKITLPSSADFFHRVYNVVTPCNLLQKKNRHKNPVSEDEVLYCSLYFLIFSVFALKGEAEWSDLLSKLYQLYPGQAFKEIVEHLYHENIISYRKGAKEKYPHIGFGSTLPFHFSRSYRNSLRTKFPVVLFKESAELIDILDNIDPTNNLELDEDVPTGYIVAAMALSFLDLLQITFQIPEQIISFDFLSSEAQSNIFECMLNNLSKEESVELFSLINGEKKLSLDNPKDIAKPEDTFHEIQQSKNASRIALFILRQDSSQQTVKNPRTAYDFIALNTCKIFCYPNACLGNVTFLRKNVQDDNFGMNSLESKGSILTECCIIKIKEALTSYIPAKAFKQMNALELLDKLYAVAYSSQTLNDAKNIFEEIKTYGVLGIEERKLWEKFGHLSGEISLFEHLQLLRKNMLVVRVGVTSFVYVFICYARNWFVPSNVIPYEEGKVRSEVILTNDLNHNSSGNRDIDFGSDNSIQSCDNDMQIEEQELDFIAPTYFLPRTWRYPDGSLNIFTVIELLQAVLSFVIISPGVTICRVTEHFSMALQPVQTLELLEVLEKAHCVVKYYCKKLPKRTLFSKPSNIYLAKSPKFDDIGHVESLPGAVCNLAILQETIVEN